MLGRFNDYSVQQEALSSFVDTHRLRGKNGLKLAESVGALVATLYQVQRKARCEVDDCISGFRHLSFSNEKQSVEVEEGGSPS